uniref:RING-type E3 ubiquitin transferase n=1 Tax=Aegilops tauschii TaxID=37682 RepID=N1R514_AEGTA
MEAEMRRLRLELKQTMDMYSTACKEALTAKQKATELQRWKEEEQPSQDGRLTEETALALIEQEKAKARAAIEAAEASQRLAELEAQKRIAAERRALKGDAGASSASAVGLARRVPPSVADTVTQCHMTSAAGTFCYIDPEYQQTGMLGVKSDVYSLGVMLLQIITARPPMGLTHHVARALDHGTIADLLDPALHDWPVDDAGDAMSDPFARSQYGGGSTRRLNYN